MSRVALFALLAATALPAGGAEASPVVANRGTAPVHIDPLVFDEKCTGKVPSCDVAPTR